MSTTQRNWRVKEGALPLWAWGIIAFVWNYGIGSLNHNFGKWIGFYLFSPKGESVFAHSKMIALPWILFLFAYHIWQAAYKYYDYILPQNKLSGAVSLVFQSWFVIGFYYFFCEFHIHGLWLDILNFGVTTLLGFVLWIFLGRWRIPVPVDFAFSVLILAPLFTHQQYCTYETCNGTMYTDWSVVLNGSYCAEDRWA